MRPDIEITWEVEDGYVGGSRPQTTYIDRDEWDACETEDERQTLIEQYVHEDFLATITWNVTEVNEETE